MKLLLLFLCFKTANCFSQQMVVANSRENIVYCGVDNPLSALVAGYPCKSVVLTIDNDRMTKAGCGEFLYQPTDPSIIKIKVWVKNGKRLKKVGEALYRAKRLPLPVAMIGNYQGGNISLKILIAMGGIRAILLNTDFQVNFSIVRCTITALRNKVEVFNIDNTGAQYNEAALNYLKNLKTGDRLLISSITCKGPDEKEYKLDPLEFTITE